MNLKFYQELNFTEAVKDWHSVLRAPSTSAPLAQAVHVTKQGQELAGRASAGTLASAQTRWRLFICERGILDLKHEERIQCRP